MKPALNTSYQQDDCFGEGFDRSSGSPIPVPNWLRTADRTAHALLCMMLTVPVVAFTAPAAGDLAFEIYDIIVNDGIEGPIGAMIAVASIVFGIFGIANRNWFAMGGGFAGTTAMVAGEDIVTTVGFII